MNSHQNPPGEADVREESIEVEAEIEERVEVLVLPSASESPLVDVIRARVGVTEEYHFFERDQDEPFKHPAHTRRHIRVVGHRCREVTLEVRFEHETKTHHFRPSATVFKALQWAVSKHAYNLDPMQAAKANLILPGAEAPLPREDVLGKYVKPGECRLVLDLTLKDFTNG